MNITEKSVKLESLGFVEFYIDVEPISESINIREDSITILSKVSNSVVKLGDLIHVKIIKIYVRPDQSIVLACTIDLDNFIPLY